MTKSIDCKVILISPDQRGGAPKILLEFAKRLKKLKPVSVLTLITLNNSSLAEQFNALGHSIIIEYQFRILYRLILKLENRNHCGIDRFVLKIFEKIFSYLLIKRIIALGFSKNDLVIANTVCSAREVKILKASGFRVNLWIMEGFYSTNVLSLYHGLKWIEESTDKVFFLAQNQLNEFLDRQLISSDKAHILPPFIALKILNTNFQQTQRIEWRKKYNIDLNCFVVGGCGNVSVRKSPDLLILMAKLLKSAGKIEGIKFVWVGSQEDGIVDFWRRDLDIAELNDCFQFIDAEADTSPFFSSIDCFALVSREEPYGLVVLEAAMHGKPSLCFEKSGGAPEFVGGDSGVVIPYLDINQFSEQILNYKNNNDSRIAAGENGKNKVKNLFSDRALDEVILTQIFSKN